MKAEFLRSVTNKSLGSIFGFFVLIVPLSGQSLGQVESLFDSVMVERQLKSRYHLTSKDLRLLRPMIDRQNEDLLITLGNRIVTENTNFMSLWEDMKIKRAEFEGSIPASLSSRQKLALRAARMEAETIISAEWLDHYFYLLEDALELDWLQGNLILKVFETERRKRLQILSGPFPDPRKPYKDWHTISAEREEAMLMILSPAQMTIYRKMIDPARRLVA